MTAAVFLSRGYFYLSPGFGKRFFKPFGTQHIFPPIEPPLFAVCKMGGNQLLLLCLIPSLWPIIPATIGNYIRFYTPVWFHVEHAGVLFSALRIGLRLTISGISEALLPS